MSNRAKALILVVPFLVTLALFLVDTAHAGTRPTENPNDGDEPRATLTMSTAREEARNYAADFPLYGTPRVGSCTRRRRDIVECHISIRALPPYTWACRLRIRIRIEPPDYVYVTTPSVRCK